MVDDPVRRDLRKRIAESHDRLVDICVRLVRVSSENPPGDTRALAETISDMLGDVTGAEVALVSAEAPVVNLVARLKGRASGRRLVFNGHLDTFPVGDPSRWSVDPLGGVRKDGRIHGRGVSDMKAGLACSMLAFRLLAEVRAAWAGELVLTFSGDEETMGPLGTEYLLETVPHASGDAMICGDAGSPRVLRFGEKGLLWLEVTAAGRAAHGAHVHLGENAIERLADALTALKSLRDLPVPMPPEVARAIDESKQQSEAISGAGEAEVLKAVTVNFGLIDGGSAPNLVAERARALVDIRLPPGLTLAAVEAAVAGLLSPLEGVSFEVTRGCEPSWTDPDHEIVRLAAGNCRDALSGEPAINLRVGASDSGIYRRFGVPSVICGLTPYNMGAADEYVTLEDLYAVGYVHTMTAYDFLSAAPAGASRTL